MITPFPFNLELPDRSSPPPSILSNDTSNAGPSRLGNLDPFSSPLENDHQVNSLSQDPIHSSPNKQVVWNQDRDDIDDRGDDERSGYRIENIDFAQNSLPASWQPTQTQLSPDVHASQEISSTFVNPKSKYCEFRLATSQV
jgi:hypothetical protein